MKKLHPVCAERNVAHFYSFYSSNQHVRSNIKAISRAAIENEFKLILKLYNTNLLHV